MSLSWTEAGYYASSEAAKEIKVVVQILLSMGIPVKLPVIVQVDNMGAIFMSENAIALSRMKVTPFCAIGFVGTLDNASDSFTKKNVTGNIFDVHVKDFVMDGTYLEEVIGMAQEGCQGCDMR